MSGPFLLLTVPSKSGQVDYIVIWTPFSCLGSIPDRAGVSPTGVPVSAGPGCVCREAAVVVWLAECSRRLRFGEEGTDR
jgi:hypothetical protein